MICNQCPRRCNAERNDTSFGFCKMPEDPIVAKADLHFWEEPCISGDKGSGTIFFSGCSLGCIFCQNKKISSENFGKKISVNRLVQIMCELEARGAHNINFVTPTHYFHSIKSALEIYRPHIPLIYNSSGYELEDVIMEDIFDIYLLDFKYFSNETAFRYSGVKNYVEYASAAIKAAAEIKGKPKFLGELLQSGVIIRHLLLPNHTKEAISIVDWVRENTPDIIFSLMAQYIPLDTENAPEINRRVTKREYNKVSDYLLNSGIKNVYLQELESATENYIPNFNLLGV